MNGLLQQGMARPQGDIFPKNEEDVAKFVLDIDKALFSEQQMPQVVQVLKEGANSLPNTIGQVAGALMIKLMDRRAVEQGVQMHGKLAIMGAARAIEDLSGIAAGIGLPPLDEQGKKQAANVAGAVIQQRGGNGQQGQSMQRPMQRPMQQQQPQQPMQQQQPQMQTQPPGGMVQ